MNERVRPVILIFLGLFLVLAFGIALRKAPTSDEAWFFSPIYDFLHHRGTGTSILDAGGTPWSGLEKHTYWQVPVYFVVEAGWMQVFGLSLIAMRSLTILAGAGFLLLWSWVFRALGYSRNVAVLIFVLLACDYAIVTRSAEGRMDMLSAAFGVAGLAAYLKWREASFSKAILWSQFGIMLAGLSHPIGGVLYGTDVILLMALYGDWRKIRLKHIGLATVPYLAGAAAWSVYIAQDPADFKRIFLANFGGRVNAHVSIWQALLREITGRYLGPYGFSSKVGAARLKLLIVAAYFGAVLIAAAVPTLRRQPAVRHTFVLLGVSFLLLTYCDQTHSGNYLIHIFPFYVALLAAVVLWVNENLRPLRVPINAAVVGLLVLQVAGIAYWIKRDSFHKEYLPLIRFIQDHAPAGKHVTGPAELAFSLGFDGWVKDDMVLGVLTGRKPDLIIENDTYREWQGGNGFGPVVTPQVLKRLTQYREIHRVNDLVVYEPAPGTETTAAP